MTANPAREACEAIQSGWSMPTSLPLIKTFFVFVLSGGIPPRIVQ
jgi:hypothetical protein